MPNQLRADAIEATASAAYGGDWATASAWIKSGLLFDATAALDALLAFLRERGMRVVPLSPCADSIMALEVNFYAHEGRTNASLLAGYTAALAAAGDGLGGE